MKEKLRAQIEAALEALLAEVEAGASEPADPLPEFVVETPRDKSHGDFSCNAAMLLAKRLRRKPRDIAEAALAKIGDAGGLVSRAEVAGPGFMNFFLAGDQWQNVLIDIVKAGADFGRSDVGRGRRVQVEFVSANPTGPLSTGHGRQAVLGDCIARLLGFTGWAVTREYYFNNGGRQMRVLGQSVKARYLELLGRAAPPPPGACEDPENAWVDSVDGLPVVFPKDGYQGDYIRDIAQSLVDRHGEGLADEDPEGIFRDAAQESIFADIRATLDSIDIRFDEYFNETSLYEDGKLEEVLADLRAKDLVYDADEAVWLKATAFGLDRDRVVVKRTGEPTYLLPDIAYHREKFRRGFEYVVDVQGADHIEQFPFVRGAVAALDVPTDHVELVMHQFVTITRGGEKVKQSTRRATFVTVDELVENVGADVFRYFMIERKADGHLDFDLDLAESKDWRKNPAYKVQYAHARTHGIERKADESGVAMPAAAEFDPTRLELPEELELVRTLAEFPELVAKAADTREPHHVAYYLRDLAGYWSSYLQDGDRHRVLSDDEGLSAARLGLALAVRTVLANGLSLLGVSAPELM